MRFWFTADTHFGHHNIIEYCRRPFKSLTHMDRELIRRWNSRVAPGDTVYHLGDFAFGKPQTHQEYLDQLNGSVIIIQGNHDRRNNVRSLLESAVIRHGGWDIWLSHEPKAVYKMNFCGHVHNHWRIQHRGPHTIVNVGVDAWDYRPININEINKALGGTLD